MAKRYYSGACFSRTCGRCDARSMHTNLGFLKRVGLSLLLMLVHLVYKTDAYGYAVYTYKTDCESYCKNAGYFFGGRGSMLYSTMGYFVSNLNASSCYCVTEAEYMTASTCRRTACSITNAIGSMRYDLINSSCNGVADCRCASGYYVYSTGTSCAKCPVGYYCSTSVAVGYAGLGRTVCSTGYYCSTTGLTAGTKCPAGRYTSTTTQSTCNACSAGYYCPGGTSVICPQGYYCPVSSMSAAALCPVGYYCPTTGLKAGTLCPENPPATTASSGAKSAVGYCYIPADTSLTDDIGTYEYTQNCLYAS